MTRPVGPGETADKLAEWDNEGGAQSAFGNALPGGITTRLVREFMVGPYCYTDLQLAIAERDRQNAAPGPGAR